MIIKKSKIFLSNLFPKKKNKLKLILFIIVGMFLISLTSAEWGEDFLDWLNGNEEIDDTQDVIIYGDNQRIKTEFIDFILPTHATHYWNDNKLDTYEIEVYLNIKNYSNHTLKFTWEDERYLDESFQIYYDFNEGVLDKENITFHPLNKDSELTFNNMQIQEKDDDIYKDFNNIDLKTNLSFNAIDDINVSACGTLTANNYYTLNKSISTTGTCITIGGHNVTLDMKGYRIIHSDTGSGDYGINNNLGYDNLTVMNGEIKDFGQGIRLNGGVSDSNFSDIDILFGVNYDIVGAVYGVNFISSTNYNNDFNNILISGQNDGGSKADGNVYAFKIQGQYNQVIDLDIDINVGGSIGRGIWMDNNNQGWINDSSINIEGSPAQEYGIYVVGGGNGVYLLNVLSSSNQYCSLANYRRLWWYNVYVNDSNGNPIVADIKATGKILAPADLTNHFSSITNASGWMDEKEWVMDYRCVSGVINYYDVVISANNSNLGLAYSNYNLTIIKDNKLDDNIQYECWIYKGNLLNIPQGCYYNIDDSLKFY